MQKLRIRIEEKKTKDDILGITTQILEPAAAAAEVSTDTNTVYWQQKAVTHAEVSLAILLRIGITSGELKQIYYSEL